MNKIIAIGREFGSGGREFARRLAEELNYEYYDKEIISEIAKKTSLSEEYIQQVIEKKPHHLYPITTGHTISYPINYQFNQIQSIFNAQCEILKQLAEHSNCVIVGRCANYILKDYHPLSIFIYANLESKVNRCKERLNENEHYSDKELIKMIRQIDKNRAKYYEFYTGESWGKKENYDLCINTTNTNIKEIVPIIAKMLK